MSEITSKLLFVLFPITMVVAPVSWVLAVYYGYKAITNARPGVRLWGPETFWNPANVILRTDLLTEEGRSYRRKLGIAVACFVIPIVCTLLAASGAGRL